MWYEILPSFGIVFAALALPSAGGYWINRAILGNHYKRDTRQEYDKWLYLRDWGLSGDVYKQQGLEAIPDEKMGGFVRRESETSKRFEQYKVVPDIIPDTPEKLNVKYDDHVVQMGNELTPVQVRSPPTITWAADKDSFYAVQLIDPDASFPQFTHWLVVNIPGCDLSAGTTVFDYMGSGPRKGTGLHRYIFLLFKQHGKLSPAILRRIKDEQITDRGVFNFKEFQEAQNLTGPIAANFFRAQYDDYVPVLYRKLKERYNF